MLKLEDRDEYRHRYHKEILSVLDPDEVLQDLGVDRSDHDILLLCFENNRSMCHRVLVSAWFFNTRGIRVPELGNESITQVPV